MHRLDRLGENNRPNGLGGIVEVFDLHGHPKANTGYAWSHATDDPDIPKRSVTSYMFTRQYRQ